jgi:hypothetical protein
LRGWHRATSAEVGIHSAGNIVGEGDRDVRDVLRKLDDDSVDTSGFWSRFYDGLHPLSIDVFRLEFLKADYSQPSARAISFWLIVIGTAVVLIPTLITSILVFSDLFGVTTEQAFLKTAREPSFIQP